MIASKHHKSDASVSESSDHVAVASNCRQDESGRNLVSDFVGNLRSGIEAFTARKLVRYGRARKSRPMQTRLGGLFKSPPRNRAPN